MNFEKKVGFDIIRERIRLRCSTPYAQRRAENEAVSTNESTILRRLELTDEMRVITMFETKFPQDEFTDCTGFLPKIQAQNTCISLENLKSLSRLLQNHRQIIAFLQGTKTEQYPRIKEMAGGVSYFPEITRRIDTIIDKNGDIKENATPELSKICSSLNAAKSSIGRKVQSILERAKRDGLAEEDANVSIRDGKLLIPVNSYNKRGLPGIVQGASASGKTYFIEPLEVVEMNNRVSELEFEKQREILRILTEFSDFLRPYIPDVQSSAEFICELDFIRAKAECARQMGAGKPIISQEGTLKITNGRHPVLESVLNREGRDIVPVDLELTPQKHILIISGPNAGGKSVCLKTVGILQYMLQWGMLVSCSEVSEFPILENFFIDIGDEQSMENDLSTYSSHLQNMKNLLAIAGSKTLVLIDEFGSGTEPAAGGAIAETILEELEKNGVYGVITSHYTNLKVYAEKSEGVINGAMMFDSVNIKPLYKLEIGVPGNSFAFDLARKIGLPEQIVKRAEEKAGDNFIDLERQLRKISRNRRKLDEKLARIRFTDKNLEDVTERYTQELSQIKQAKKQIIEDAKAEAKAILDEANKKIEATIKSIKEAKAEKEKTKAARENLKKFEEGLDNENSTRQDEQINAKMEQLIARKKRQEERKRRKASEDSESIAVTETEIVPELAVGCAVKVEGSDLIGKVVSIEKKNVTISIGDILSKVKIEKVHPISNREFESVAKDIIRPVRRSTVNVDSNIDKRKIEFKTEIDIRGYRLGDALDAVSRYIDDALLVGASQVRILHGKGTGVLKEEIRKYLRTIPGVESAVDEDVRFGGAGITIVTLD